MSYYEFLLFGHLLFVVAWVGTDIGLQVLSFRVLGAAPARRVEFLTDVEWLGQRLLIPASLLVVVFGILLVGEIDGYDFGQTWIVLGLTGFLFSAILGATFLGPEAGRLGRLAAERGPEDREVQSRIARVLMFSRIELVVLVLVVLDMVLKARSLSRPPPLALSMGPALHFLQ